VIIAETRRSQPSARPGERNCRGRDRGACRPDKALSRAASRRSENIERQAAAVRPAICLRRPLGVHDRPVRRQLPHSCRGHCVPQAHRLGRSISAILCRLVWTALGSPALGVSIMTLPDGPGGGAPSGCSLPAAGCHQPPPHGDRR
jgi:hypothetical protein